MFPLPSEVSTRFFFFFFLILTFTSGYWLCIYEHQKSKLANYKMDHDQTTKGSILSYKLREIPCLYSFENLFKEKEISKKRKKTTGRILSDKTLVLIVITERKNSNLIPVFY